MDDCGGFWRVQRRLQEEARVALALARPMARMQVEVERQIQLHRRSPVADLVSQREKHITQKFVVVLSYLVPFHDICVLEFSLHAWEKGGGGMNYYNVL